jgi:hypothetical protein
MAYYLNEIIAPKLTKRLNPKEPTTTKTLVVVDYDSIVEPMKAYGKDPLEMDFFRIILDHLKDQDLNIIDFVVYSNLLNKEQTSFFKVLGIQFRHASNNGKNSSDLELTVDTLRILYRNPYIGIIVIISSDRDVIPLLKAIQYENKISHVITTRNGFNQQVAEYAKFHEYIEEIFDLTPEMLQQPK